MRIILIRHGQTEHNRGNLTLGRADVPLNERGRQQARAVAASFTRPPDAIYASPLARAADTARTLGDATGVDVQIDDGLIEMDVGEMEHLTSAELRERYPEFLRAWLGGGAADARMPGGETLREVQARAWAAVERLRGGHSDGTVAVVTHNFVILTLLCRALDLPISGFRRLKVNLASRSTVQFNDRGITLLHLNDTAHLLARGLADDSQGREARR